MPYLSSEYIRGVKEAAQYAHDNYDTAVYTDIIEAVLTGEILKEYEEENK